MATTIKGLESLVFNEVEADSTSLLACDAIKMFLQAKHDAELAEIHAESESSASQLIVEPGPYGGFYSKEAQDASKRVNNLAKLAYQIMKESEVTLEIDSQQADAYMFKEDEHGGRMIDKNPGHFLADQVYLSPTSNDFFYSRTNTWLRVEEGQIDIRPAA